MRHIGRSAIQPHFYSLLKKRSQFPHFFSLWCQNCIIVCLFQDFTFGKIKISIICAYQILWFVSQINRKNVRKIWAEKSSCCSLWRRNNCPLICIQFLKNFKIYMISWYSLELWDITAFLPENAEKQSYGAYKNEDNFFCNRWILSREK